MKIVRANIRFLRPAVWFLSGLIVAALGSGCLSTIAERRVLMSSYAHSFTTNSPDGNNVVFTGYSRYTPRLMIQYIDRNGEQRIAPIGHPIPPLVHQRLVKTDIYDGSGNLEIYVAPKAIAENSKYWQSWKNLTNNRAHDGSPTWSSDGTKIVFCSLRDGHSQVYIMDADGGNVRKLTQTPVDKMHPRFLFGGKRVMFMTMPHISPSGQTKRKSELRVADVNGTGEEKAYNPLVDY